MANTAETLFLSLTFLWFYQADHLKFGGDISMIQLKPEILRTVQSQSLWGSAFPSGMASSALKGIPKWKTLYMNSNLKEVNWLFHVNHKGPLFEIIWTRKHILVYNWKY